MKKLVIYGAWYFGHVVKEAAEASGWEVLGYVDPDPPDDIATLPAIGDDICVFAAIGDNAVRAAVNMELAQRGRTLATIVHPKGCVSPSAKLGAGVYVAEMAVVRTNASVGDGVVLQAGSVISHDCSIKRYASFGPNAAAASKVTVGERSVVGVGAIVSPGLTIGDDCTVAAGSVAFKSVGAGRTLVGNPGRATPSPEKEVKHSDWEANNVW